MPSRRWHLISFGGTYCVHRHSGGNRKTGITAYKTAEPHIQAEYILYIQHNKNLKFNYENILTNLSFTNLTSRVPKARSNEDFFYFLIECRMDSTFTLVWSLCVCLSIYTYKEHVSELNLDPRVPYYAGTLHELRSAHVTSVIYTDIWNFLAQKNYTKPADLLPLQIWHLCLHSFVSYVYAWRQVCI